jgi:threonine/homoserine/homoserine lactone efflux protein
MLELNSYLIFTATSMLLAVAPGPDIIFVLTQSISNGRIAGIIITTGLCSGLIFHTAIVAFGISVILMTSPIAFNIIKHIGVAYMLYLAWNSFRASVSNINTDNKSGLSNGKLYRRGIIMNVSNPKVSIFFMAFLPQFTNPAKGSVTIQLISLGLIFIAATFIVFGAVSQMSGIIGGWIAKSEKGQLYLNRIAGSVFIALAVKLILTAQK